MPLPVVLQHRLRLPVISAPMFLVSGPELVIAACKAGIVGSFPAPNARTIEELESWLQQIGDALEAWRSEQGGQQPVPFAMNLIVHPMNTRLDQELALCERFHVPLVITSVGNPASAVARLHDSGTTVFHDVISLKHAEKAIAAGVDGLILVSAGAGGHTGQLNPFAFVRQVREIWQGPLVLGGSINDAACIRAALALGADMVYMGSRFLATQEAMSSAEYKQMLVTSSAADVLCTPLFSGLNANYLRPSMVAHGLDPDQLTSAQISDKGVRAWKDIWSAGHGVGGIHDIPTVAELVQRLMDE